MKPGKKKLVGKQHMLDKNKDGTISGEDFKMMAGGGSPNKEKFIAKTKGGKTRQLAKTGTKLRIGATKKAMGPVGGLPVDEKGLKVFTGKEGDLPQKKAGGGSMKDKINEAMGYKKGGRVKAKKVGKEKSYKAKSIGGKMSKARGMGAATRGGKFQGVF